MSRCLGVRPLAAAVALAGAACNVPGARIHNLKELHEDTGRHALSAQLLSGPEYYLRYGLRDLFGTHGLLDQPEGQAGSVENPLASCLSNAGALARIETDDEDLLAAQVALLAWLAVDDPWHLTREACVGALGTHARRLGIQIRGQPPSAPADVAAVRDVLARLVAAVRGSAAGEAQALAAACDAVDALELDREGALRLLRGAATLVAAVPDGPSEARLRATIERLEAICVREALLAALKDEPPPGAGGSHPGWRSPRVRAAAVRACVKAFGDPALAEILLQLDREPSVEVVSAALAGVARRGLPEPAPELAAETSARLRERWIETILVHAFDNPSGTVRVAAMRALSRVARESGAPQRSLREEDWQAWDRERRLAGAPAAESPRP